MNPYTLVVRGNVVTGEGILDDMQIAVRNGVIASLHTGNERLAAEEIIDARGKLVFPGIIDAHVHCYSYSHEGVTNATRSAVAGGVTSIVDMPFDAVDPVTTDSILRRKIIAVNKEAIIDVALLGTIPKTGEATELPAMVADGICGLKLSVTESDPKRFPRINDAILHNILPQYAAYGLPVGFHAENDEIIRHNTEVAKAAGRRGIEQHGATRPPLSEYLEIAKLLEFAAYSGVPLHLNHVSLPRSIAMATRYKKAGCNITTETCPHYLLLDEGDMVRLGMRSKINPPLRENGAGEGLWKCLLAGEIDILASDHAPWPLSRKASDDVFANASGSPSVETLLPLMFSEAVARRGAHPSFLARHMAENPARRFGLASRKGRLFPGMDADITILDPAISWVIHADELFAAAGWTPFEGVAVQGKVVATIVRGRLLYNGRDVLGHPGDGRFLPADRQQGRDA